MKSIFKLFALFVAMTTSIRVGASERESPDNYIQIMLSCEYGNTLGHNVGPRRVPGKNHEMPVEVYFNELDKTLLIELSANSGNCSYYISNDSDEIVATGTLLSSSPTEIFLLELCSGEYNITIIIDNVSYIGLFTVEE